MAFIGGRRKPEAPAGCPEWARTFLFTGDEPARDSPEYEAYVAARFLPAEATATLEDLWREHRGALLREWIRTRPGTRPPWWWTHEAVELRRFLPGQGIVPGCAAYFYDVGVPLAMPEAEGELIFEGPARVESQAAYLRRLQLFLEGERGRVKSTAYRPEVFDFTIPEDSGIAPEGLRWLEEEDGGGAA